MVSLVTRQLVLICVLIGRLRSDLTAPSITAGGWCWARIADGRRLHPQFIVRSVMVENLPECKKQCQDVLFNCHTIVYGRGKMLRNNTCQMSDWEPTSFSVGADSTDATPAPLFTIYGRYDADDTTEDARRCRRQLDVADAPLADDGLQLFNRIV